MKFSGLVQFHTRNSCPGGLASSKYIFDALVPYSVLFVNGMHFSSKMQIYLIIIIKLVDY
jgi:hypothetical protein